MQDLACREVTELKVVNCSCINDILTIRGGLHEIVGLVILGSGIRLHTTHRPWYRVKLWLLDEAFTVQLIFLHLVIERLARHFQLFHGEFDAAFVVTERLLNQKPFEKFHSLL